MSRYAAGVILTRARIPILVVAILLGPLPTVNAAEEPQPRKYPVSKDVVYEKCVEAFGRLGWNLTGFDRESGIVTANTGKSASTFGDIVNVVLTSTSDFETLVVISSETPGQLIAWGKNKRNKEKFYSLLDELMAEVPAGTPSAAGDAAGRPPTATPTHRSTGSGFFVTDDGHLLTNFHVVEGARRIDVYVDGNTLSATLVNSDRTNDIALLKVESATKPIAVVESHMTRLASDVFTVGFPLPSAQGVNPKFTRGEISSLTGLRDDVRYFQVSVPVQPGNSGGALFDAQGNVVGMTTATMSTMWALENAGVAPQNVNFALKSNYILAFLKNFSSLRLLPPKGGSEIKETSDLVDEILPSAALIVVY